jgi:hypothetical protein
MPLAKKQCRVCGNPYEACRTAKKNPGAFDWKEVACSPECGSVYLEQILSSRKPVGSVATPADDGGKKNKSRIKKAKPATAEPEAEDTGDIYEPVSDSGSEQDYTTE